MEANGYVELFEEVKGRVGDDQVALGILQEIGKDGRVEKMCARGVSASIRDANGEQPATSKQIGYLKSLGVGVPTGLTKQGPSELIDQHAQ